MKQYHAIVACILMFGGPRATNAHAQILNLDVAPSGPALPKLNAASALAQELINEAEQIEQSLLQQAGHERIASEARACLRRTGALLLGPNDARPWSESAAVVAGLRLARMRSNVDSLLQAFSNERRAESAATQAAFTMAELISVDRSLQEFAGSALELMRRADPANAEVLGNAAADALAPLADAIVVLEGRELPNPWPRSQTRAPSGESLATLSTLDRPCDPATIELRVANETGLSDAFRDAILASLAKDRPLPLDARAMRIEPLVHLAISARRSGVLRDATLAVLEAECISACLAIRDGVPSTNADNLADTATPRMQASPLLSIERCAVELASLLMQIKQRIALDREPEKVHDSLRVLANECATARFGTSVDDGEARRAALERCNEVLSLAIMARMQPAHDFGRELQDIALQLERDSRNAELSALRSLEQIASGATSFADPETVSALERVRSLTMDRLDLKELSNTVDRITALKPSLAVEMDRRARLIARLLVDKFKRPDAIRALSALRDQTAQYAPFPLETRLKRDDAALTDSCGSSCAAIGEIGGARRIEWAQSWARGDTDSSAFARMDRFVRLTRALRTIAGRPDSTISRRVTDSISMWGNWCVSRAAFVPATTDGAALLRLACASLLAGSEEQFDADLNRLEATIPIATLVESLGAVGGSYINAPVAASSDIAPLAVRAPTDAWLLSERARFAVLCRSLLELEGARTRGDATLELSLRAFASSIAQDLNNIIDPPAKPTGQIPSIDTAIAPPQKIPARGARGVGSAPATTPAVTPTNAPSTSPRIPAPTKSVTTKPAPVDGTKPPSSEEEAPTGTRVPRVDSKDRVPRLPRQGSPTDPTPSDPKKDTPTS